MSSEKIKDNQTLLTDADTEIGEVREELMRHKAQLQSCKMKILLLEAQNLNEPLKLGTRPKAPPRDKDKEKRQREAQRRRTIRDLITEFRHSLPHHVQVRGRALRSTDQF